MRRGVREEGGRGQGGVERRFGCNLMPLEHTGVFNGWNEFESLVSISVLECVFRSSLFRPGGCFGFAWDIGERFGFSCLESGLAWFWEATNEMYTLDILTKDRRRGFEANGEQCMKRRGRTRYTESE